MGLIGKILCEDRAKIIAEFAGRNTFGTDCCQDSLWSATCSVTRVAVSAGSTAPVPTTTTALRNVTYVIHICICTIARCPSPHNTNITTTSYITNVVTVRGNHFGVTPTIIANECTYILGVRTIYSCFAADIADCYGSTICLTDKCSCTIGSRIYASLDD